MASMNESIKGFVGSLDLFFLGTEILDRSSSFKAPGAFHLLFEPRW